jgi:AraC-like DNA-binding protein
MTIRYVVRSAAISGFRVEAGDAADLLLRKAGIDPALLDSEDHQIEIEQLQRLLAEAAEHLQRPDFGMRVAQHQGIEMLGLLGKVVSHATTLEEAFGIAQRYMSLHSSAEHWQLQSFAGQVHIIRTEHSEPNSHARQYHEMAVAAFLRVARLLLGQPQRPLRVTFTHSRIGPLRQYLNHFGCEVLFEQEHDSLVFPQSMFRTVFGTARAANGEEREQHLANARERLQSSLELQIRNLITEQPGLQHISIDAIAATLGLHPRSLQRRLRDQHIRFRDLVQDVRIRMARWHLQASRCDVTSLSDRLSYSDLSSFSRAFKRHTGMSPVKWRQQFMQTTALSPPELKSYSPYKPSSEGPGCSTGCEPTAQ